MFSGMAIVERELAMSLTTVDFLERLCYLA